LDKEIISIIERNRISSTEVADALGKKGVLEGMLPINSGKHVSGKVKYVYTFDETNWPIHEQVQDLEGDVILFVDTFNCGTKAIFGDLVAKYLILYKRVKGIVVNGYMRDIPNLKKHNYPIWCLGYTPLGCANINLTASNDIVKKAEARKKIFEGGIITCDDSGCTLIKELEINEETYKRLDLIELQEDIWFFCIDTLKWSTYETVCLKRYLTETDVLPPALRKRLMGIPFEG